MMVQQQLMHDSYISLKCLTAILLYLSETSVFLKCPDCQGVSRSVYMLRDTLGLLSSVQIIQVHVLIFRCPD